MSEATNTARGANRRVSIRHRHPAIRVRLDGGWRWSADWSVTGVAVHLSGEDALAAAIRGEDAAYFDGAVALGLTGRETPCGLRVKRWVELADGGLCVGLAYEDGAEQVADLLADWTLTSAIKAGYRPADVVA